MVQHPCQVSFKSIQGCRRSWEDKQTCVKILSVKDHNSAKICRTWIISPHALLNCWFNIPTKLHSNPCKDVGGVEKTNFDGTEGRNDGRTEWRTKQTLNAPLPFYDGGIKNVWNKTSVVVGYWSQKVKTNKTVWNSETLFVFIMNNEVYEDVKCSYEEPAKQKKNNIIRSLVLKK